MLRIKRKSFCQNRSKTFTVVCCWIHFVSYFSLWTAGEKFDVYLEIVNTHKLRASGLLGTTQSIFCLTFDFQAETEPKLTVPPAPRISHLLIRDQVVESAAWRVTSVGSLSTEVVIAYGDGAFQIWPIVAAVSQQPQEPIIVSKREPPSTPYGMFTSCPL